MLTCPAPRTSTEVPIDFSATPATEHLRRTGWELEHDVCKVRDTDTSLDTIQMAIDGYLLALLSNGTVKIYPSADGPPSTERAQELAECFLERISERYRTDVLISNHFIGPDYRGARASIGLKPSD